MTDSPATDAAKANIPYARNLRGAGSLSRAVSFVSTRGAQGGSFREAVLQGLASDGGLLLPRRIPRLDEHTLRSWRGLDYRALCQAVLSQLGAGELPPQTLAALIERAYRDFERPEVVELVPLTQHWGVLELFHGPTCAFKDIALQWLGTLFSHFLSEASRTMVVLGATSGDTGSAAMQALQGREGVSVFILYPRGRISAMQERQMIACQSQNTHALAIEGSFDDAQAIVKTLFQQDDFRRKHPLGAVNSINWARIAAQSVYFFWAYFRALDACCAPGTGNTGTCCPGSRSEGSGSLLSTWGERLTFSVPSGNFGHALAGWVARSMGLPMHPLILGTNANDILARLVRSGTYRPRGVQQTLSPSMDIQTASNLERYLHHLGGGDAARVRGWLKRLAVEGEFTLSAAEHAALCEDFEAAGLSDAQTLAIIREVHREYNYLLDPHSAVGVGAAWRCLEEQQPRERADERSGGSPAKRALITMATAHPGKFGTAIERAIGKPPPLPQRLRALNETNEQDAPQIVLPATVEAVRDHIEGVLRGE